MGQSGTQKSSDEHSQEINERFYGMLKSDAIAKWFYQCLSGLCEVSRLQALCVALSEEASRLRQIEAAKSLRDAVYDESVTMSEMALPSSHNPITR